MGVLIEVPERRANVLRRGTGRLVPMRSQSTTPCSIEGCIEPSRARGWCVKHWTRWQRHGSPLVLIKPNESHGRATVRNRTYNSWVQMKARCYNPKTNDFKYWGGRGITVCERWLHSFLNFLADMGERPEGKTLDRYPDKDGNYEPGNCRWATAREQLDNRRLI